MEWLRWYHGAISDDKWPLIARKSGQTVATVVAVWASLLECASQADERGSIEGFDPESIDALFGLEDGATQLIIDALSGGKKPRIASGRIAKWEERQPKREDGSAERAKEWRERKKAEKANTSNNANASERTANAEKHRVEKSREEEIREDISTPPKAPPAPEVVAEGEGGIESLAEPVHPLHQGQGCVDSNGVDDNFLKSIKRPDVPKKLDSPSKGTPEYRAFMSCWEIYPVRQGHEDAWREWMRLTDNGTIEPSWVRRCGILRESKKDGFPPHTQVRGEDYHTTHRAVPVQPGHRAHRRARHNDGVAASRHQDGHFHHAHDRHAHKSRRRHAAGGHRGASRTGAR